MTNRDADQTYCAVCETKGCTCGPGALVTREGPSDPIPMLLWCPECSERHVDLDVFAAKSHHTHACQHCGHVWRPAIVATVGVRFLPGFKDAKP